MQNNEELSEIGVYMESPEELEQKRIQLLESAIQKLSALGLTEEEARVVIGV